MEVAGWVQVSLGILSLENRSQNKYYVCMLKVVSYYDLSVLSMSVMGFQKNLDWGWVLYPVLFWIFGKKLICKAPYETSLFNKVLRFLL